MKPLGQNGNVQYLSLTAAATPTFLDPIDGGRYILIVVEGSSTPITWPSNVKWPGGLAPVQSSTSGNIDIFSFVYEANDGDFFGAPALNYSP